MIPRRRKPRYYGYPPSDCFYLKDQSACSFNPGCKWTPRGCRVKKYVGSTCPTHLTSGDCATDARCTWSDVRGCTAKRFAFGEHELYSGGARRSRSRPRSRRYRSRSRRRTSRRKHATNVGVSLNGFLIRGGNVLRTLPLLVGLPIIAFGPYNVLDLKHFFRNIGKD